MSESGKKWPQYLVAITSSISAIGCGLHFGWPSPTLRLIRLRQIDIDVDVEKMSNIVSVAPFGYIASGPFSVFFVDLLGRKISLLVVAAPQIVAWILIANAQDILTLYAAKLIAGAAEGALFTILPLYLCEISHPSIRGHVGSIFTLFLLFGVFLINCYGPYVSMTNCAYISVSAPILFVISFIAMPESPYFLIMKGRIDDARSSLKRLRHLDDVDEELNQLTLDVERQMSDKGSFKEMLFIKSNRKALFILLGVRALQHFSGNSAFCFYSDKLFKDVEYLDSNYSAVIYNGTNFIFVLVGSFLLDSLGRRRMLLISLTGVIIILLTMGGYFLCLNYYTDDMYYILWFPILGMTIYTLLFDVGLGVAPNLLSGEVMSVSIKTKMMGVIIIYCALMMSASSKLFEWLESTFDIFVPFFIFSLCCIIGLPFVYFYIPETRGKSLEEIQQELGKN